MSNLFEKLFGKNRRPSKDREPNPRDTVLEPDPRNTAPETDTGKTILEPNPRNTVPETNAGKTLLEPDPQNSVPETDAGKTVPKGTPCETLPEFTGSHGVSAGTVTEIPDEVSSLIQKNGKAFLSSEQHFKKGGILLETYRIESDPIKGGMGSVWRVRHLGWNKDLALKRPKENMFRTERQKELFVKECESWIRLGLHSNIVSCYYVREIDSIPAVFSEWMDGGSLEKQIRDRSLYSGTEAEQNERLLDVAIQFARGLRYAHDCGLIHQDVKPDNLLLSASGEAKVADFGLAKAKTALTAEDGTNPLQEEGTILTPSGGYTPAYCSMEQMNGEPLTRRTDIYSWAVSVMEMYIGCCPWESGVVAGLACEEYLSSTRVPLPEGLRDLLIECMASLPDERPHDFSVIEERLRMIYQSAVGQSYPRPAPAGSKGTAASLNNRAVSFLDIDKREEAEKLLKESAQQRHPDGMLNLALYRWRMSEQSDTDMLQTVSEIESIYPGQSEALAAVRRQIYTEGCGKPDLPRFRTVTPDCFFGDRMGGARVYDGKLLAVIRRRWTDGTVYNYVCHFDINTGRLLAQYPPEGTRPGIVSTGWEGMNEDGTLLFVLSSNNQYQGTYDVRLQQKINPGSFVFPGKDRPWVCKDMDANLFFDKKTKEILPQYQDDIPLLGSRGDGDKIYHIYNGLAGNSDVRYSSRGMNLHEEIPVPGRTPDSCEVRIVAQELTSLESSSFLIRTKKEEYRIYNALNHKETILFQRGKQGRKTVLKSERDTVIMDAEKQKENGKLYQYAPGCRMLCVYGRYFTLPDLLELYPDTQDRAWKSRTAPIRPLEAALNFNGTAVCVKESLSGRVLFTVPFPELPSDSKNSRHGLAADFSGGHIAAFQIGQQPAWAVLDMNFFSSLPQQMNYRISAPVSVNELQQLIGREQELLDAFRKAETVSDRKEMIRVWKEAISTEGVRYTVLHEMNTSLSERCEKQDLIRIIGAPADAFMPCPESELPFKGYERYAVSPDGKTFALESDNKLKLYDAVTGRPTEEMQSLFCLKDFNRLKSICIGPDGNVYIAYRCSTYVEKYENKDFCVASLGPALNENETLLRLPGTGPTMEIQLLGVTNDNSYLLMCSGNDSRNTVSIDLFDLRKKATVRSFLGNEFMESVRKLKHDSSFCTLGNESTAIELLWDYAPAEPQKYQSTEQTRKEFVIDGDTLLTYNGGSSAVIPDGITEIAPGAFSGCTLLRSAVIPEGVRHIGSDAFCGCTHLETVDIRSSVLETIGDGCFAKCTALADFRMTKNSVSRLNSELFIGCDSLRNLELPEGILEIGERAFSDSGIRAIRLPSTLQRIGKEAFFNCLSLHEISLPEGLKTLGEGTFRRTQLASIRIPSTVDRLPAFVFQDCSCLKHIENAGSIRIIEPRALTGAWLKTVQVAYGAEVNENIFSDGFYVKANRRVKQYAVTEPTRIHARERDTFNRKMITARTVTFLPVMPDGTEPNKTDL